MASWTPVPLSGFSDDEEDAKTVLISKHARMAWEEEEGEADLTTPAAMPTRDDARIVAFTSDPSLDQSPTDPVARRPQQPAPADAERMMSPWMMALAIGMSLPLAVAAAVYLLA